MYFIILVANFSGKKNSFYHFIILFYKEKRMKLDKIAIIDMGSRHNAALCRFIRTLGVFAEIKTHEITAEEIKADDSIKGIIINGGENRAFDGQTLELDKRVYETGLPTLEIDINGKVALAEDESRWEEFLLDFMKKIDVKNPWGAKAFLDEQIALIKETVRDEKVLLALSGGVDSSVCAALIAKAIGKNLICIHVDHGLMREGESEQVVKVFGDILKGNLIHINAQERYLSKLAGVTEPEKKRKIIGEEFIDIFAQEAKKLGDIKFLGQGTIYPDIIESGTLTQKVIKSHHNVGGLPEDLKFELIEPLKDLFKDEVRAVGKELGLPESMVNRQPFPGPGLGVRCLGAITKERLEALRHADKLLREEFEIAGLHKKVWQYFTIVPDFKSVGLKGGDRVFEYPCIIRAVNTVDAMTATIERLDYDFLEKVTHRITHEVEGINRVLYDLSPKPTGTIEWE